MKDFIKSLTEKYSYSEDDIKYALGGLLYVLRKNAQKEDFEQYINFFPDGSSLLSNYEITADTNSMIPGLMGDLMSLVNNVSFSQSELVEVSRAFSEFAKPIVGEELNEKILKNVKAYM